MRNVLLVPICLVALFASAQVGASGRQNLAIAGGHLSLAANRDATFASPSRLPAPEFVLRKDVREVRVEFSVTDRQGRHVTSISRNDFQLTDNGTPVAELTGFQQASDLPLDLAILIDSSASTEHELPTEKQLALEFLQKLLRPQDRALIAGFSTHLIVPGSFTKHFDQLEDSVRSLHAGGLTALNDSIFELAADDFIGASTARKVLIVITDGYDSVSRRNFKDAMNSVLRSDVTVYTISIRDKKSLEPAACLAELSALTGGHSYVMKDLRKVKDAFSQIDADLRTYYVATYRAPDRDRASFHALNVKLDTAGLSVQNRKGYFREE